MILDGYELYKLFVVDADDTDDLMFVRNLPLFELNMTKTN